MKYACNVKTSRAAVPVIKIAFPIRDLNFRPTISDPRTKVDIPCPVRKNPIIARRMMNCHTLVTKELARRNTSTSMYDRNKTGILPKKSAAMPKGRHPMPHPMYMAEFAKAASGFLSHTRSNWKKMYKKLSKCLA